MSKVIGSVKEEESKCTFKVTVLRLDIPLCFRVIKGTKKPSRQLYYMWFLMQHVSTLAGHRVAKVQDKRHKKVTYSCVSLNIEMLTKNFLFNVLLFGYNIKCC